MKRLSVVFAAPMAFALAAPAYSAATVNYSYDTRGRLVQVSRSGTVNNSTVTQYQFDRAHNRTRKKTTGAP